MDGCGPSPRTYSGPVFVNGPGQLWAGQTHMVVNAWLLMTATATCVRPIAKACVLSGSTVPQAMHALAGAWDAHFLLDAPVLFGIK